MFNHSEIFKRLFATRTAALPGTVQEPLTKSEAAEYWARMARQSQESGGW